MSFRACFSALFALVVAALPAAAQSVVSTHAGVVHYFEGAVSIGGKQLQPQFGRFPEIADGAELSTAEGRAELLLGTGVILRVAENSAIKMLSSSLSDTRLEILTGTAILQSKDSLPGNALTILYKEWQMRIPRQGVYRIDSNPEQLRAYDGEVEVRSTQQGTSATLRAGETLPLASVLVPEETLGAPGDEFNSWTFDRSEAINADNAMADQIVDDPALYPDLGDASGLAMAGYTYFPTTTGNPYMNYGSYGAYGTYGTYGTWSPYIGLYRGYAYGSSLGYILRSARPGLPGTLPLRPTYPGGVGYHPGGGYPSPRPIIGAPVPRTAPAAHPIVHPAPVGHR